VRVVGAAQLIYDLSLSNERLEVRAPVLLACPLRCFPSCLPIVPRVHSAVSHRGCRTAARSPCALRFQRPKADRRQRQSKAVALRAALSASTAGRRQGENTRLRQHLLDLRRAARAAGCDLNATEALSAAAFPELEAALRGGAARAAPAAPAGGPERDAPPGAALEPEPASAASGAARGQAGAAGGESAGPGRGKSGAAAGGALSGVGGGAAGGAAGDAGEPAVNASARGAAAAGAAAAGLEHGGRVDHRSEHRHACAPLRLAALWSWVAWGTGAAIAGRARLQERGGSMGPCLSQSSAWAGPCRERVSSRAARPAAGVGLALFNLRGTACYVGVWSLF